MLDLIHKACTTSGFFVIKNHGIEDDLLEAALSHCKALFALPEDKKIALKSDVLFTVRRGSRKSLRITLCFVFRQRLPVPTKAGCAVGIPAIRRHTC